MTTTQLSLAAGVAVVIAAWCARHALSLGPPSVAETYRRLYDARPRTEASVRPGAIAKDVDAAARGVIADAGFGDNFGHGLGHGIGLQIHEAPGIRQLSETKLVPGMVFTIEPGIYLPGWGGVRIEDDVLVTADGCEVLTHVPRELEALAVFAR